MLHSLSCIGRNLLLQWVANFEHVKSKLIFIKWTLHIKCFMMLIYDLFFKMLVYYRLFFFFIFHVLVVLITTCFFISLLNRNKWMFYIFIFCIPTFIFFQYLSCYFDFKIKSMFYSHPSKKSIKIYKTFVYVG